MFVIGTVVLHDQSGTNAIAEAKERNILIRFHRNLVFVNGRKFVRERFLWETFPLGKVVKFFVKESNGPFAIRNVYARYEAELAWIGDVPLVNPFCLSNPAALYIESRSYFDAIEIPTDCPRSHIYQGYGMLCWASQSCGILIGQNTGHFAGAHILFYPDNLFTFGKPLPRNESFQTVCAHLTHFEFLAKPVSPQRLFGVVINFKGIVVWRGSDKNFKLSFNANKNNQGRYLKPQLLPSNRSSGPTNLQKEKDCDDNKKIVINESDIPQGKDNIENRTNILNDPVIHDTNASESAINYTNSKFLMPSALKNAKVNNFYHKLIRFSGILDYYDDKIIIFGRHERKSFCDFSKFYIHQKVCSCKEDLQKLFGSQKNLMTINSYSYESKEVVLHNLKITMTSLVAWIGKDPMALLPNPINENDNAALLSDISKEKLSNPEKKSPKAEMKCNSIVMEGTPKKLMEDKVTEACGKPAEMNEHSTNYGLDKFEPAVKPAKFVSEEMVRGYILTVDSNEGIMTSFHNIIVFGRKKFYIHGKKVGSKESFMEIFDDEHGMIFAWVVLLEKPRIVQNCVVYSRAVCAWIGREPTELKALKEKYFSTKTDAVVSSCVEKMLNDSEGFHYLVGRIIKIIGNEGIIACEVNGTTFNIGFSLDVVYIYGVKILGKSLLQDHSSLLTSSLWSVFAKSYPFHGNDVTCDFKAFALWHFQNQQQMLDEFTKKLSIWNSISTIGFCECNDKLKKESVNYKGFEVKGLFVTVGKGFIVYQIEDPILGKGNARCITEDFWVDGCCCGFSSSDKQRTGQLLIKAETEPYFINDIRVTLMASCGWVGPKPNHIQENSACESNQFGCNSNKDVHDTTNTVRSSFSSNSVVNAEVVPEGNNGESRRITFKGRLTQIHSNTGCLLGPEGDTVYFQASKVFLYGTCLKNVDLWNVLVQDQEVVFTKSEDISNAADAVWIGQQTFSDPSSAAYNIWKWCKDNMVVDSARDILISELVNDFSLNELHL